LPLQCTGAFRLISSVIAGLDGQSTLGDGPRLKVDTRIKSGHDNKEVRLSAWLH
jgi:hypothetical protein